MPYTDSQDQYTRGKDITMVPAGTATTATGAVANSAVDCRGTARLKLTVSAVSGTSPSMTVTIETSRDNGGSDTWRTVAAFGAVTAAGSTYKTFGPCDRYIRANVTTFSGSATPTVTWSLTGETV